MATSKKAIKTESTDTNIATVDNIESIEPVETVENVETVDTVEVTELQQLTNDEVTTLEAEITALKEQIKDKQKRIKELTKKPGTGTSKKELAANWFKEHPDYKPVEFITFAMNELEVSPVYASTLMKLHKK